MAETEPVPGQSTTDQNSGILVNKPEIDPSTADKPVTNANGEFWCEKCGAWAAHTTESHGKKGGVRAFGGRPPGSPNKATVERAAIQQAFIDRIHRHTDQLLNAALTKAMGETYLIRKVTERDSKGKVTRVYHETVRDEATILQFFDEGMPNSFDDDDEYYYLSTKPVDMTAVKELYDRAFGKPIQKSELSGKDGAPLIPDYTPEQAEQLLRLRAKRGTTD